MGAQGVPPAAARRRVRGSSALSPPFTVFSNDPKVNAGEQIKWQTVKGKFQMVFHLPFEF